MDERSDAAVRRSAGEPAPFDVLIRNGRVVDGTGNPAYRADVGLQGDRVAAVGPLPGCHGRVEIDATDRIVAPGFIDAHSHSDATIAANPTCESTIRQGITTEVVGNCGTSQAPMSRAARRQGGGGFGSFAGDASEEHGFAEYLARIEAMGTSANLAWLVGHNSIRLVAGALGSEPSEDQLERMEALLRVGLEAGAVGFSTGLEFEPGRSSLPSEIHRLARVVREYDGLYASHIRNRADQVLEALDEFLAVVRAAGLRGEVSHLNIRYNTGAPEAALARCIARIEQARAEGFDVLTDMTPLTHGIGQMAGILPPWLRRDGSEAAAARLADPAVRQRLRTDCDRYWRFIHRGEWDRVRMQNNPAYPELNGLGFPEISRRWNKDPWDCYFDILAAAGGAMDGVVLVARLFTDEHLRETIGHPLYMLVVDGYTTRTDGPLAQATAFPLHFMGMTHFLTHHVRQERTLSLEEAIRKMTSMPATHFRLRDRGLLRPGAYADVVVFDFAALATVATVERPLQYVRGVEHVLVNGVPVVHHGEHTGRRPGRALRR
jgi:N-acyl-D-amino-acid deacylase